MESRSHLYILLTAGLLLSASLVHMWFSGNIHFGHGKEAICSNGKEQSSNGVQVKINLQHSTWIWTQCKNS